MREIKFRAWDKEEEKMWFDVGITIDKHVLLKLSTDDGLNSLRPTRAILMQFTGLKDKNGVEIYEGDILAINYISNIKYQVRFGNYEPFGSNERQQGFYLHDGSDSSTIPLTENYKILGNIYEHPDLLKHRGEG